MRLWIPELHNFLFEQKTRRGIRRIDGIRFLYRFDQNFCAILVGRFFVLNKLCLLRPENSAVPEFPETFPDQLFGWVRSQVGDSSISGFAFALLFTLESGREIGNFKKWYKIWSKCNWARSGSCLPAFVAILLSKQRVFAMFRAGFVHKKHKNAFCRKPVLVCLHLQLSTKTCGHPFHWQEGS